MREEILSNFLMIKFKGPGIDAFYPDKAIDVFCNMCPYRTGMADFIEKKAGKLSKPV